MNQFQQYIYVSKYAKFLDSEGRRETWEETVNRYIDFFKDRVANLSIDDSKKKELLEVLG